MRTLARSHPHRARRATAVALASVASVALIVPAAAAAPAPATPVAPETLSVVTKAPDPFLFQYTFNHHLKIGGGNFTVGGRVTLLVKLNNGTVVFRQTVIAQTHSITPGGAIYVETTVSSPCAPGNNGYARAYDHTTETWSPRLPVPVCQRID
ncbi:hypothetical protein [Streptomyces showdoensis]|uniref:Uncharacterized protein n=1 Tax=Streptomyces showdoensis TaxID=68268 RepID=A0A2P2GVL5_STREW|nr:hypothetical protein [Streptomyces showdoensis]KKZ74919.1 hypothetical protein VO63_05630 [Streptomyces showdoensis]